ncbi:hypothetical protein [Chitinophaga cymbidii]|uniref:Uncharacterized protein n=1 Tax=Chitinophaga cymbidii TaxID=1096750 RepID=A0A512RQV0_9BACT|nr:hypothetical protein [Chitinophaga cymbidii]GEP98046.1 hypothetical protein CCY01nite_43060 [Chitinophaga cymbidii]
MKTPLTMAALAAILLATGCLKDPHPSDPDPGPTAPGWVVSSWTVITSEQFPLTAPKVPFRKQEAIFHYNSLFKPVRKLNRSTLEGDTLQLYENYVDSFFYDDQHRVAELRGYLGHGLEYMTKYSYNAQDTLPAKMEYYQVNLAVLELFSTKEYFYEPEDVLAVTTSVHGIDSSWYDYENGNFMNYVEQYGITHYYQSYTDVVNPLLFHNIPNGLVIAAPLALEAPVRISRNQWETSLEIQNMVVDSVTMNAQGLPAIVHVSEPYSNGRRYHDIRYEYIPAE